MVYENITEWRRSRSFESSKFLQAVPFKSFTHNEIYACHSYYHKKTEFNVSKAAESNTLKDTNNYISVDNELVETSSKRQKN